jgi:cholesterol oxidase
VFGALPQISRRLGDGYSGNGDFLSFVVQGDRPSNPNRGPVITQYTDFNLFAEFDRDRAFILEDAAYPAFAAWFVEGAKPGFLRLNGFWRLLRHTFGRWVRGATTGSLGYAFNDLLGGDLSQNTSVLLCMGIDRSNGSMSLDGDGRLRVDWPYRDSLPLYEAIIGAGRKFRELAGADAYVPLPTWYWPFRQNVTVHSLGGCVLADAPANGVVAADRAIFGQVFGYRNLYVADGAIVPSAVGANPVATISALSELVAEGITGIVPDADL